MQKYIEIFINGYSGYANYLWNDIKNPSWNSYFYWLILVSVFFFILEVLIPWRKKQAIVRKDFWLDAFYMFFNFFLFSLIIYNAASEVVVNLYSMTESKPLPVDLICRPINPLRTLFLFGSVLIMWASLSGILSNGGYIDYLHKSDKLWEFHKVHHSVEEMGFAAHLRYHWMENIVYRTLEYLPLAHCWALTYMTVFCHSHIYPGMGPLQPFQYFRQWKNYRRNSWRFNWYCRIAIFFVRRCNCSAIHPLVLQIATLSILGFILFGAICDGTFYEKAIQQSGDAHLASFL